MGQVNGTSADWEVGEAVELCRTCVMPFVLMKRHKCACRFKT